VADEDLSRPERMTIRAYVRRLGHQAPSMVQAAPRTCQIPWAPPTRRACGETPPIRGLNVVVLMDPAEVTPRSAGVVSLSRHRVNQGPPWCSDERNNDGNQ
jgi:hypothetical protein